MPYSEAQKRATRKYIEKTYDRLELQLKKGMKDVYKAQAAAHGMTLTAYIISLLEADRTASPPVLASEVPDQFPELPMEDV